MATRGRRWVLSIRWSGRASPGTSSRQRCATTLEPVVAFARRVAEKDDATEADLLAAIPLLGRDPATRADDLKRLAGLLAATRPAAVQSAAIAALARMPDEAIPATLVSAWASASPALRDAHSRCAPQPPRVAGACSSPPSRRDAIPAGQIDAARRQRLIGSPDAAIRTQAEKLFAGGTNADRQKVIDDYKSALSLTGDKTRGKAVFAKSCAACHVLDGVGHAVGPDLAALANKSPLVPALRDASTRTAISTRGTPSTRPSRRTSGRSAASSPPRPRPASPSGASRARTRRSSARTCRVSAAPRSRSCPRDWRRTSRNRTPPTCSRT